MAHFFLLGSRWELFLKLKNPVATTVNAIHELLKVLQNDHFLWHGGQLNIYKVTIPPGKVITVPSTVFDMGGKFGGVWSVLFLRDSAAFAAPEGRLCPPPALAAARAARPTAAPTLVLSAVSPSQRGAAAELHKRAASSQPQVSASSASPAPSPPCRDVDVRNKRPATSLVMIGSSPVRIVLDSQTLPRLDV